MRWPLLALLVACSSPPPSSPASPAPSAGRAERISLGTLEAYAVEDGFLTMPNDQTVFDRAPAEVGDALAAAQLPRDTLRMDIQCLLVKAGPRVMLFDTGAGTVAWAKGGHIADSLARAGVAPAQVTDIFISHAHADHVLGLVTTTGTLAFPAATIHLSAPEWESLRADPDEDGKHLSAAIAAKVAPFPPGAQLFPEVRAVATAAHTPGHSSYVIGTGSDTLFFLGDLAHHSVLSVQHPEWINTFDGDREAARAVRQQTLAELASSHARVFAGHFPYPGVGRFEAAGAGFAWRPARE